MVLLTSILTRTVCCHRSKLHLLREPLFLSHGIPSSSSFRRKHVQRPVHPWLLYNCNPTSAQASRALKQVPLTDPHPPHPPLMMPMSHAYMISHHHSQSQCNNRFSPRPASPPLPHSGLPSTGHQRQHPLLSSQTSAELQQPSSSFSLTPKAILEASPPFAQPYLRLVRFDKPIGTWLLYWPCTWSIAMAAEPGCLPDLRLLALFGVGAFLMRGAGCIINDMWDKDFDKKVERTRNRPLASGELTPFQALVFLGSQLSLALLVLLQLNTYSILLGAASMALVVTYPLAKRYTYWPQVLLGLAFNYGVLLGWSAVRGFVDWPIVLPMYLGALAWTLVYDTIYAHQDKYDDMLIGVKSTALKLGDKTIPWLAGFSAIMVSGMAASGYMTEQTWPFYLGLGLTAGHLGYQLGTVNLNDAEDCASKFRANSYIGILMFLGITMSTYLKGSRTEEEQEEDTSSELKSMQPALP